MAHRKPPTGSTPQVASGAVLDTRWSSWQWQCMKRPRCPRHLMLSTAQQSRKLVLKNVPCYTALQTQEKSPVIPNFMEVEMSSGTETLVTTDEGFSFCSPQPRCWFTWGKKGQEVYREWNSPTALLHGLNLLWHSKGSSQPYGGRASLFFHIQTLALSVQDSYQRLRLGWISPAWKQIVSQVCQNNRRLEIILEEAKVHCITQPSSPDCASEHIGTEEQLCWPRQKV